MNAGNEKNKSNCKRWRENIKKDETKLQNYKFKNKERMRNARQTARTLAEGNEKLIEENRKYNRIRQRERRQKLFDMSLGRQKEKAPYECKQTLAKAVKKVEMAMPKDFDKKLKVLEVLAKKYNRIEENKNTNESSRTISERLVKAIKDFYENDDVSVQAAGKKDTIIIKGKLVAKRFMIMTVSETYELFKKYFPSEEVGLSTFFKMRPRHVQLANKMPHNMCVCMYHANFGFLLQSCSKVIPSFPRDFETFLKEVCCDIQNEYCMTSHCKKCLTEVKDDLIPLAYLANMEEEVNWQQWRKIENHIVLSNTTATISDLVFDIEANLSSFKTHFFVKRAQQKYFEDTKRNLKPSELLLQIDFAENYRLTHQNEIQSAHFSYHQVTIFTCVAWFAGASQSLAVISDKLTHNKHDVYIFVINLIIEIKKKFGNFSKVFIFSDGSCAQFKNKYILTSLADILKEIGCQSIEWNFFASSHGKGAVDGVGAVIKRKVWQITKSKNVVLPDALAFYQCAENNIKGIKIYFMPSAQIESLSIYYKLDEKWKDVQSIPGISQMHWFGCNGQQTESGRTAYSFKKIVFDVNDIIHVI